MRRALPLLLLAGLLLAAGPVAAHGRACLQADGTQLDRGGHGRPGPTGAIGDCPDRDLIEFVIGWAEEPPYAGVKNGLDLGLRLPADNTPVANVTTLQAQYEFGGRIFPLGTLEGAFGRPGWYGGDIWPTRPGLYTLRITGTVETRDGVKTLNFTHQPAEVHPGTDIQFPEPLGAGGASDERLAALEAQVAALQAQLNASRGTANGVTPSATPGFEPLLTLTAVGVAVVLAVRRRA